MGFPRILKEARVRFLRNTEYRVHIGALHFPSSSVCHANITDRTAFEWTPLT